MPIILNGKRNQEKIRTLREKENYKFLWLLEVDTIKQVEMREKIKKEYLRRTRKLPETKLYPIKIMKRINLWDVPQVRYLELFMNWIIEELLLMNQETRKLMTMPYNPRYDVDYMCQEKKEEDELPALKIASIHRYNDSIASGRSSRLYPVSAQTCCI